MALAARLNKTPAEVDEISLEDVHRMLAYFAWEAEQQREAYKGSGPKRQVARGVTATEQKTTTRLTKRDATKTPRR